MPGITRMDSDTAGGKILTPPQSKVFVNKKLAAIFGTPIENHGDGDHASPTMKGCSEKVFIGKIGVCRAGDDATCGHLATGSSDVFAG